MHTRRLFLGSVSALATTQAMAQASGGQDPFMPFKPRLPPWTADWYRLYWEAMKQEKGIATDTIVIHHTALPPGITWQELSKLQREQVYAKRFGSTDPDPYVLGLPAYSGHFRLVDGKLVQVFYAYHWLVREDGTVERLLADTDVGWHAGNWDWNLRSLGICFDGDYSKTPPSDAAMHACGVLIAEYADLFPLRYLKGHNEVRKEPTECPGSWFLEKGADGLTGRERLLGLASVDLPD